MELKKTEGTDDYVLDKGERARAAFCEGRSCSQAVLCAFTEETGLSEQVLLRLGAPFGGGIARTRSVCGAVTGMLMAYGLIKGTDDFRDHNAKTAHYEKCRELMSGFERECGSAICADLLVHRATAKAAEKGGAPEQRTEAYYKNRSCADYCAVAAQLLAKELKTGK